MRPLRASLLALLVALGGTLGAQDAPRAPAGWNDARTQALVRAAIDRRALQLADTGLLDYTARAHGYLTFLAQLGEGFPLPPKVIKSDELVVEVYWAAPDRSKQRVIGRRDTLLLPTDIEYHRDHLGVVQGNFPAIIRLGDGDEVRDVPHPLSEAGLAAYDYRLDDSLAIRTADRAIDVMMVSVRPKDDRAAAAVGAVYIDRASASVVRMTLSFTRAALRDRQLEDVSVILENGLVEGRYWLPRRQEIEIRRSASWMDFPARGIIRGRWEICCVRANIGLPATTFVGPEVSQAPRSQLEAHPFEGTILDGLPEEVRALDDADVRRVQEEARALVRAGALARTRSTAPAARGISDIVRVNRAEGLALGAGLTRRLGYGLSLGLQARYGTADDDAKLRGTLEWRTPSLALAVGAFDDFAEAGDAPEVSGLRNSVAAQEFGSDWSDPFGVRGGFARVEGAVGAHRLSLGIARQSERALAVRASPTSGRYEPLLAATTATGWRATVGWSRADAPLADGRMWRARALLGGVSTRPTSDPVTRRYLRASFEAEGTWPAADGRLRLRTIAAAVGGGAATVPLQDAVYFGGPVTGPGYAFHSLAGRAGVSQRIEWQAQVPFVDLDLGRFGRVPSTLTVAPWVHGVGMVSGLAGQPRDGFEVWPSVGVGLLGIFDLVRVDIGRTTRGGRWLFSLDLARDLWPVL